MKNKLFDYQIAKSNNRILKRIYAEINVEKFNWEAMRAYETVCYDLLNDLDELNNFIKYYKATASRYGDKNATESPIFKVHEEFKECYNKFLDKFENEYKETLEDTYLEVQKNRKILNGNE